MITELKYSKQAEELVKGKRYFYRTGPGISDGCYVKLIDREYQNGLLTLEFEPCERYPSGTVIDKLPRWALMSIDTDQHP